MAELLMSLEQLHSDFAAHKGWDKQYRLIIQLGKRLAPLAEAEKTVSNQVKGCESLAWLVMQEQEGIYHLKMDSDSRVVKGLMAILLIIFQGKTAQQIAQIDVAPIFEQLGLLNHLSPSRASGLLALVDKIKNG